MPDPNTDRVDKDAIAPEVATTAPRSTKAEALLANESDEAKTMASDTDASDGPPEMALSEEAAGVEDAAAAEVMERVNSGMETSATTAAPVDPEAAALAKGATTPNDEKS